MFDQIALAAAYQVLWQEWSAVNLMFVVSPAKEAEIKARWAQSPRAAARVARQVPYNYVRAV